MTHLYSELYEPLAHALHLDVQEVVENDGAIPLYSELHEELYWGERWDRVGA